MEGCYYDHNASLKKPLNYASAAPSFSALILSAPKAIGNNPWAMLMNYPTLWVN
jgi:hypothetical protein